jgi:hypothetical protein
MAADAGEQLKETNRHLRDIASSLKDISKALKALNNNYADVHRDDNSTVLMGDDEPLGQVKPNGS